MRRFSEQLRESRRAFGDVFRNPNLRRLQLAWAASIVATWAYSIAVVVYAYGQGGARAVGIVGLARWLAAAAASPFAALLGDRYDRRLVMVASDAARALLIGAAALAAYTGAAPVIVYVLSGLVGIAATAFRPAVAALVPTLAQTPEELTAANVVASTIESVGIFGGPALGGLLLAATSTGTVFVVTAAALVWSALLIFGIHPLERAPSVDPGSIRDELLAGFRTIAREKRLRVLVALFAAQTFVDGMLNVLIVVLALKLLAAGQATVGFLNSAVGIGGLLGAVVAAALVGRKRLAADFGLGIVLWGLPIALIAVWPNETVALIMLGVVGIGNTLVDVAGLTLLQRAAPDEVVARVFGVLESILLLTIGLGAIAAPILLSLLGTRTTLIVVGAILPILVIPAWPSLRAIDSAAHVPSERIELLRGVPIFAPLPPGSLEQLAGALDEVRIAAGETLFRQGDPGDRFYVIEEGGVEVSVDGGPPKALGAGDAFGEIALLRDVPRTATVRATNDSRLLALDHTDFIPVVTGYAPSLEAADAVIGMRLGPARAGLVRA